MGMYCCCGVKKRDKWICNCDWDGWFACFQIDDIPKDIPIKHHPDKDGTYTVRIFEDGIVTSCNLARSLTAESS